MIRPGESAPHSSTDFPSASSSFASGLGLAQPRSQDSVSYTDDDDTVWSEPYSGYTSEPGVRCCRPRRLDVDGDETTPAVKWRRRRLPGPGDGLSAHVSWKTALADTGWLPRSRADLSGRAGWRGLPPPSDDAPLPPFRSYATAEWPAQGVRHSMLAPWLLRWNGPLAQWLGRQSRAAEPGGSEQSGSGTRRQRLARLMQQSSSTAEQGTNPGLYEAYMTHRLLRFEQAQRLRSARRKQKHRGAGSSALWRVAARLRAAPVRRTQAVLLGSGISYASICIATALALQPGTCAAVLALVVCTAAAVLATRVSTSRTAAAVRAAVTWVAAGAVISLFPALLAAAAMVAKQQYAAVQTALEAAPGRWAPLTRGGGGGPAVPVAYLQAFPGDRAYLLSDAVLCMDALGTGHAYWPLSVGTNPGKASPADVVGVTPGWAVPVVTSCAVPLLPAGNSSAAANLTSLASIPAWVICHNAGAGVASCPDALAGNFTARDAAAHEALATCLQSLASAPQPMLLFALSFDPGASVPDATSLAAPAVRDAIISHGLPVLAYNNITALRLADSAHQVPDDATSRAAATGAAMGVVMLTLAWGAARWTEGEGFGASAAPHAAAVGGTAQTQSSRPKTPSQPTHDSD